MKPTLTRLLLACGAMFSPPSMFSGYSLPPRPARIHRPEQPSRYNQERYDAAVAKRKRRAEKLSKEHP